MVLVVVCGSSFGSGFGSESTVEVCFLLLVLVCLLHCFIRTLCHKLFGGHTRWVVVLVAWFFGYFGYNLVFSFGVSRAFTIETGFGGVVVEIHVDSVSSTGSWAWLFLLQ